MLESIGNIFSDLDLSLDLVHRNFIIFIDFWSMELWTDNNGFWFSCTDFHDITELSFSFSSFSLSGVDFFEEGSEDIYAIFCD
jgi:hypothetical protein